MIHSPDTFAQIRGGGWCGAGGEAQVRHRRQRLRFCVGVYVDSSAAYKGGAGDGGGTMGGTKGETLTPS